MFFRKKEEKFFYPFAYELAESVSPMLESLSFCMKKTRKLS